MKRLLITLALASGLIFPAWAEQRSVTLSISGMTCPVCPITVRKALEKVNGVSSAKVDYDSKSATVVFDDQITETDALIKATEHAGYPSTVTGTDPS